MFIKLSFALFITLILTSFVDAATLGDKKGNGGDIFICQIDNQEKSFLSDYYQAQYDWKMNLKFDDNEDYIEQAKSLVARLALRSPQRANRYIRLIDSFISETVFTNYELGDVDDANYENGIPSNCSAYQVANQNEDLLPPGYKYIINNRLWNLLDANHKAGLILHEIMYYELKSKTSDDLRFINALIAADKLDEFSDNDLIKLFKKAGFKTLYLQDYLIDIDKAVLFYKSGILHSFYPVNEYVIKIGEEKVSLKNKQMRLTPSANPLSFSFHNDFKVKINKHVYIVTTSLLKTPYPDITFSDQLSPKSFILAKDQVFKTDNLVLRIENTLDKFYHQTHVSMYEDGFVSSVTNSKGKIRFQNKWVKVNYGPYRFYEDGHIKSAFFDQNVSYKSNYGKLRINNWVSFHRNHQLKSANLVKSKKFDVLGQKIQAMGQTIIQFDEDGNIKELVLSKKHVLLNVEKKQQVYERGERIRLNKAGYIF